MRQLSLKVRHLYSHTFHGLHYATGATASGLSAHAPHKGGQPGPLGRYMTTLVQVESGSGRLHIIIVHRCNNTRRKRNY